MIFTPSALTCQPSVHLKHLQHLFQPSCRTIKEMALSCVDEVLQPDQYRSQGYS